MEESRATVPTWETLEEALEWLSIYASPPEEMLWVRGEAAYLVFAKYGHHVLPDIAMRLGVKKREARYIIQTAKDWPPEERYLDQSWQWHRSISTVAGEQGRPLKEVAELCVNHGSSFILAMSSAASRLRRMASQEGLPNKVVAQEVTFAKVWQEHSEKHFDEVLALAAKKCPFCDQRLPQEWWKDAQRWHNWDDLERTMRAWWKEEFEKEGRP